MIRLVLVRHAKAVTDGGALGDHGRILAPRGRRDAAHLGAELVEHGWVPDRVWCSDAARTTETWALCADVVARAGAAPEVVYDRRLYLADPDRIARVCVDAGTASGCLALVGHNPGWEELATSLVGAPITLPTAGTVLLKTDRTGTWSDLLGRAGAWALERRMVPDRD